MANKQINELSELTTVSGVDLLAVYDMAESGSEKTKKMTRNNFMQYEEGTWTPVIADAASGGNTASFNLTEAAYTKVGRKVTIQAKMTSIDTTGMTGGNDLFIRGLPFTSQQSAQGSIMTYNLTYSGFLCPYLSSAADNFKIAESISGSPWDWTTVGDLTSGNTSIYFTLTYFTS